eukprot:scaffold53_cov193-Pinguiococcus_pyrenoidosus.AAC.62
MDEKKKKLSRGTHQDLSAQALREHLVQVLGHVGQLLELRQLSLHELLALLIVAPPLGERPTHARSHLRIHGVQLSNHAAKERVARAVVLVERVGVRHEAAHEGSHPVGILDAEVGMLPKRFHLLQSFVRVRGSLDGEPLVHHQGVLVGVGIELILHFVRLGPADVRKGGEGGNLLGHASGSLGLLVRQALRCLVLEAAVQIKAGVPQAPTADGRRIDAEDLASWGRELVVKL